MNVKINPCGSATHIFFDDYRLEQVLSYEVRANHGCNQLYLVIEPNRIDYVPDTYIMQDYHESDELPKVREFQFIDFLLGFLSANVGAVIYAICKFVLGS